MELLLSESPPTGVLNNNTATTSKMNETKKPTQNLSNTISNNAVSSANEAAVFCQSLSTNSNNLSLNLSTNTSSDSIQNSTNNLNSALSSSSFSFAFGSTTKYPQHQNLNSSNNCSTFFSNLNNLTNLNPNLQQPVLDFQETKQRLNYLNCDSKFGDSKTNLTTNNDLINNSISSPISNNSIKSTSSSISSSSFYQCNNSVNSLSNLTSNLATNQSNLNNSNNLFCAQQLFQNSNNQHSSKVKRTRQRVDAGEPRNSYASIANYATNRLGKTPKFSQQTKGLFDQLNYLGLFAGNHSLTPEDFLISNSFLSSSSGTY